VPKNNGDKESPSNAPHYISVIPVSTSAHRCTLFVQYLVVFWVKDIILLLIPINS
jgi:hypothetical protein